VQEYERAVIFRLGRLRTGGARGPGIFFVLPCVDTYCKVDLRTVSFDVAPQEVSVTGRKRENLALAPGQSHFPFNFLENYPALATILCLLSLVAGAHILFDNNIWAQKGALSANLVRPGYYYGRRRRRLVCVIMLPEYGFKRRGQKTDCCSACCFPFA